MVPHHSRHTAGPSTGRTTPSYADIWRKYDPMESRLSASLTERMLELGKIKPGLTVLDVATGRGEPAIPAALRVGPDGFVLGVDIDASMLRIAREKAVRGGISNIQFLQADFETGRRFSALSFDVALSRWGIMYINNPVRALTTIARCLTEGGLFVAAVWTMPEEVSFFNLPRRALEKFWPVQAVNFDHSGTFYYADLQRLAHDLEGAGLSLEHSEVIDVNVVEFTSDLELIEWARAFGMSRLLDEVPAGIEDLWEKEMVAAAESYRCNDGFIRLGGKCQLVVARK